jgi:hypothetical protein
MADELATGRERGAIHSGVSNMEEQETQLCAHEPCQCTVPANEKYCSDYCKTAGSEEVEIACDCDHDACR